MLYEQIRPSLRKRLSAEVKVDLKVAGVTLRQAEAPAATRMSKLQVVERYIDSYCHVGDIQIPGRGYFRGRISMQWGWLADPEALTLSVVVFRGDSGNSTVLLGGSRRHVLGQNNKEGRPALVSYSVLPTLMSVLHPHISELTPRRNYAATEGWREDGFTIQSALSAANEMEIKGSFQDLEFLAVPLGDAQLYTGTHSVLGTPIYVAHATSQPTRS